MSISIAQFFRANRPKTRDTPQKAAGHLQDTSGTLAKTPPNTQKIAPIRKNIEVSNLHEKIELSPELIGFVATEVQKQAVVYMLRHIYPQNIGIRAIASQSRKLTQTYTEKGIGFGHGAIVRAQNILIKNDFMLKIKYGKKSRAIWK